MNEKHTLRKRILKKEPLRLASHRLVSEAKRYEKINYFLKAESKIIDHQRMLVISIYTNEKLVEGDRYPSYRIFMTKHDYITQVFQGEKPKWQSGGLEYILGLSWYPVKLLYCADESTAKTLHRFLAYLGDSRNDPIEKLRYGQMKTREQRLEKKHKVIERRIDEKMREIKALPKDFDEWIDHTALVHSRYIYYQYNRRKWMDGYCTYCHSDVKVSGAKHRMTGYCPNCGTKVTFLAEGKSKNIFDTAQAAYFQKTANGFVVRYFSVYKSYRGDYRQPKLKYSELARHFYENEMQYYEWRQFLTTGKTRWCEGWQAYTYEIPAVYTKNLNRVLADTKYQYCALQEFAQREEGVPVYVLNYLWQYIRHPFLEYMVKIKLYRMTEDMIGPYFNYYLYNLNEGEQRLHHVLGVEKKDMPYLQEIDMSLYQLGVFQKLKKLGQCLPPKIFLQFCEDYSCCMDDVLAILKYTTFDKADRYIQNFLPEGKDRKLIVHIWLDYLHFSEELGRDMKDRSVLFPADLINAHDKASAEVQKQRDAEEKRKLVAQNRISKKLFRRYHAKYFWTDGTYSVIPPKELFDIKEEGRTLHHCVGTYIPKVLEGSSIILFVRKNNALDKPLYTMEIVNGEIRQCRGYRNHDLPEDAKVFVERYKDEVLNSRLKTNVA